MLSTIRNYRDGKVHTVSAEVVFTPRQGGTLVVASCGTYVAIVPHGPSEYDFLAGQPAEVVSCAKCQDGKVREPNKQVRERIAFCTGASDDEALIAAQKYTIDTHARIVCSNAILGR